MTEPRADESGWAFLVARGRRRGYRTILAPAFVADRNEQGVLTEGVRGDVDRSRPAKIDYVVAPTAGPLTLAYRTHRVTYGDLDDAVERDDLVTDDHGRPLDLLYGFVLRARNLDRVDEADLLAAKDQALQAYRRFLADEDAFIVHASQAYALRSPTQVDLSARSIVGQREPAVGTRSWALVVVVIAVAVVVALLAVWLRSRSAGVDDLPPCEPMEITTTSLGCSSTVPDP